MKVFTKQQIQEREVLSKAIETVTSVEPFKWAAEIHHRLLTTQERGYSVDQMIEDLDIWLCTYTVRSCTSYNRMDGASERLVKLSKKQRKTILSWLELMLLTGGKLADFGPEEQIKRDWYPSSRI